MWGKIMIPVYRLSLRNLHGLHGPRCPKKAVKLNHQLTHSLTRVLTSLKDIMTTCDTTNDTQVVTMITFRFQNTNRIASIHGMRTKKSRALGNILMLWVPQHTSSLLWLQTTYNLNLIYRRLNARLQHLQWVSNRGTTVLRQAIDIYQCTIQILNQHHISQQTNNQYKTTFIWQVIVKFIKGSNYSPVITVDSLTHWGRVTHICVRKQTISGSDNGLSPGRRQAIIWTNGGIFLIGPIGVNFSEILIEIKTFSLKKCI